MVRIEIKRRKKKERVEEETKEKRLQDQSEKLEESELEEEVMDLESPTGFVDLRGVQEILSSPEFTAPVLDKVGEASEFATSGRGRGWGIDTSSSNNLGRNDESDFKYSFGSTQDENQAKYLPNTSEFSVAAQQPNFMEVGREINPFNRNISFDRFSESKNFDFSQTNSGVEKYTMPSRKDIHEAGREDPFEREKRKYDPKLPKH